MLENISSRRIFVTSSPTWLPASLEPYILMRGHTQRCFALSSYQFFKSLTDRRLPAETYPTKKVASQVH
jgi:hypothetical protein